MNYQDKYLKYKTKYKTLSRGGLKMLAVTGYWDLKGKSRKDSTHQSYQKRFHKTTHFQTDYIVYGEKETLTSIQQARGDKVTYLQECPFEELVKVCQEAFACPQILDRLTASSLHRDDVKGPVHCPSSELLLVWLSKILWVKRSIELHPEYTHYGWIDCGYKGLGRQTPNQPWPTAHLERVKGLYVKRSRSACHPKYWKRERGEGCPNANMWFGDKASIQQFIENGIGIIRSRLQQGLTLCTEQDVYQLACQGMENVHSSREGDNYRPFFLSDFDTIV